MGVVAHSDPVGTSRRALDLPSLDAAVVDCFACPRLVAWREDAGAGQGRAVPGRDVLGAAGARVRGSRRGDPDRRPGPGGARRQPDRADVHRRLVGGLPVAVPPRGGAEPIAAVSRRAGDGLTLTGVRIAAAVRCAPPANKPTPEEQSTCRPYLVREIELLPRLRVLLALGAIGWDGGARGAWRGWGTRCRGPKPRFGHGAEVARSGRTCCSARTT